jgi:hypothetical protein
MIETFILAIGLCINGLGLCCIGGTWMMSTAVRFRRRTLRVVRDDIEMLKERASRDHNLSWTQYAKRRSDLLEEEEALLKEETIDHGSAITARPTR